MKMVALAKKSFFIILAIAFLAIVCLSLVHNHYATQGRQFDPNCPLCQLLMGFFLTLAVLPAWLVLPAMVTRLGNSVFCLPQAVPVNDRASRSPPVF
ncbi:MAG: hypothetical protein GX444_07235 [Myxococcales bacterium]|nr:hypothetical protein [Myxococcales bacterium]